MLQCLTTSPVRSGVVDMPGTPAGSDAPKTSSKHSHPPEPDLTMQEPAQMRSADQLSLAEARALLNKDHYGLDKVLMCCFDAMSSTASWHQLCLAAVQAVIKQRSCSADTFVVRNFVSIGADKKHASVG